MNRSLNLRTTLVLLGSLLALGCGSAGPPRSAKARGTVTHADKPVADAEIYFVAAEKGFSANATLSPEGKYEITSNLPPATYKIFFTSPRITKPPMDGQPPPEAKELNVPNKYRSETTSDLKAEVKAGDNTFDFNLK